MGRLIRSVDWSQTAVGPFEDWPQSLKTSLSICLGSKFPMFIWWGQDLTVFYNDAYIPFTGTKHPKYLGRPAREQWSEIWDKLQPLTDQVLKTGQAIWAESLQLFMNRRGYLEETYFTFSYSPILNETGSVGGIINPCQETTERILSERRLNALHDLGAIDAKDFSEIGSQATKIFESHIYDIPFAMIYLNEADGKSAKLHCASGVREGSEIAPTRIPTDRNPWRNTSDKIDRLRELFFGDLPNSPYDERPDSAHVFPIHLPGREIELGYLILGISPRLSFDNRYRDFFSLVCKTLTTHFSNVLALSEERERAEAMRELDRLKTQFLSNVSHELRTPLTLILAPLESIMSDKKSEIQKEFHQFLASAYNNSVRLLQMINGLLDFSRLELDTVEVSRESIDIVALTDLIVNDFIPMIHSKEIVVEVIRGTEIPIVMMDRYLYERILFNLLSNAIKFTDHGGKITVHLGYENSSLRLSVEDTGIGIADKDLEKLFKRFQQIEGSASRRFEGTGLGLSLVREFSKLLGGHVSVKSELGKGSRFSVVCSAPKSDAAPRPIESAGRYATVTQSLEEIKTVDEAPTESSLQKVLIAEDNPELAWYIESILKKFCLTSVVHNGREALRVAREWEPDLILSDVMMPELDGLSLCKIIKSDSQISHIPVVLLTALTHRDGLLKGWKVGADDYLFKPFHPTELAVRVRSMLHLSRLRKDRDTEMLKRRDLEEFAYLASHDIREPLRVIRTYTDLLKEYESDPSSKDAYENIKSSISKNAERAQTLIEDLIQYSTMKKDELGDELVDCNDVVEHALAHLKDSIRKTGAVITYKNLPVLTSHFARLVQVFQNLIQNAIKYCEQTPRISIEAEAMNQEWIITIKDNGIGFDQKFAEHIFLVFKRLHDREKYSGNGIGLAICRSVVSGLGGRIWAQSKEGEGSRFFIALPRTEVRYGSQSH